VYYNTVVISTQSVWFIFLVYVLVVWCVCVLWRKCRSNH